MQRQHQLSVGTFKQCVHSVEKVTIVRRIVGGRLAGVWFVGVMNTVSKITLPLVLDLQDH